jgi:hypothetical protein
VLTALFSNPCIVVQDVRARNRSDEAKRTKFVELSRGTTAAQGARDLPEQVPAQTSGFAFRKTKMPNLSRVRF